MSEMESGVGAGKFEDQCQIKESESKKLNPMTSFLYSRKHYIMFTITNHVLYTSDTFCKFLTKKIITTNILEAESESESRFEVERNRKN